MKDEMRDSSDDPASPMDCRDVSKAFGGVSVLRNVSLRLEPGTITALAGENGAGKSTLMKIASGQYKSDSGEVLVRGSRLPIGNAQAAKALGVSIVPQELATIPALTVYENIFVGRELRGLTGLKRREMLDEAQERLNAFGLKVSAAAVMDTLPVGVRQIIEIIKATYGGARVVLLDEPSSAIAGKEVERLMKVMRTLRDRGVALLFTTHKMEEIRALADRVVVLRDGTLVSDSPAADVSDDDIVTAMIGRELDDLFPERPERSKRVALQVDSLEVKGAPEAISFKIMAGEIVGLAGLVGAGRTELIESIVGNRKAVAGQVSVGGKHVKRGDPAASITAGMAFVPEDRKQSGVVLSMNVLNNGSLPHLESFSRLGVMLEKQRRTAVHEAMESVHLRSRGLTQELGHLSGGNQQKVVLARWLTGPVDVLLLDEPTRGVDVGARSEIYRIITSLAAEGVAVLMASSDMPEVLSLAHRAFVMREGYFVAELDRDELDGPDVQETIFRYASGMTLATQ